MNRHGGNRRGAGRSNKLGKSVQKTVRLSEEDIATALKLGKGYVADGIRNALALARASQGE